MQLSRRQIIAYVALAAVVVAVGVQVSGRPPRTPVPAAGRPWCWLPRRRRRPRPRRARSRPTASSTCAARSARRASFGCPPAPAWPTPSSSPAAPRPRPSWRPSTSPPRSSTASRSWCPNTVQAATAAGATRRAAVRDGRYCGGAVRARQHQHGVASRARRPAGRRPVHGAEDHRLPHGQRRLQDRSTRSRTCPASATPSSPP